MLASLLTPRSVVVMHPESPGERLSVLRRPILAWLYPEGFATLGEALEHERALLRATTPTMRVINMLESAEKLTLNDRKDCPNCNTRPKTFRPQEGGERTVCEACGLAVEASDGDSYGRWNQLVDCIAGKSGTTG